MNHRGNQFYSHRLKLQPQPQEPEHDGKIHNPKKRKTFEKIQLKECRWLHLPRGENEGFLLHGSFVFLPGLLLLLSICQTPTGSLRFPLFVGLPAAALSLPSSSSPLQTFAGIQAGWRRLPWRANGGCTAVAPLQTGASAAAPELPTTRW